MKYYKKLKQNRQLRGVPPVVNQQHGITPVVNYYCVFFKSIKNFTNRKRL
jgi:hypothetical protein